MLVIESMHRFRLGRSMFAVCVVDLRPEYRMVALRHEHCSFGMPQVPIRRHQLWKVHHQQRHRIQSKYIL